MQVVSAVIRPNFVQCLVVGIGLVLNAPGQVVTSFSPEFGSPGESILIQGSGFAAGVVVRFGGPNGAIDPTAQATSPSVIYARVPPGAVTGPINVKVGTQSSSSAHDFQVIGLGPFLTGFSPKYGAVNATVIISGWHLTNTTAVKFGGKSATSFMPNANGSQITALIPAGATNGPITVSTWYGTSNTLESFTVIGPGPFIEAFFPAAGNAGTTVTIDGAHFTGVTNVTFNGKSGTGLFVQSDSRIQVNAPAGVSTGPIRVASPKGFDTTWGYFLVPPVVTGFAPVLGRAGTNITITGSNLLGTTVWIGGQPATILSGTNASMVVKAPTNAPSGKVRIESPVFSFTTTSNFNYQPLLTGFSPRTGSNSTVVTLSGANLNEGLSTVKFNGVNSPTNRGIDPQTVLSVVPPGATTGFISVTTTNGTFTLSNYFFLPPVITAMSSTNSAPGTTVTLTGTNFIGTTNVNFNGTEAAFFPATNNNSVLVRVPTNFLTGPVGLAAPGGVATGPVFYGRPILAGFAPTSGVPGTAVNLFGTNFAGATAVLFGSIAAPFQFGTNENTLIAIVPTNAATGPIRVVTPGGTAVTAQNFVINLASDLRLDLKAAATAYTGSNIVYLLTVTNAGPLTAPNVVLLNTLPTQATLRSNHVSQGTVTANGNTVRAAFGALAVSNTATLRIFTTFAQPGTFVNSASVAADYADPSPADNAASAATTILPLPLLSIQPYSASQWMIARPLMLTNFNLQFRPTFSATQYWSNHPTPPLISGTNKFIVEPASEPMRFYRLRE